VIREHAECNENGEPVTEEVPGQGGMTRYKFPSPEAQTAAEEQLRELRETIKVTVDRVEVDEDRLPDGITPAMVSVMFVLSGEAEG